MYATVTTYLLGNVMLDFAKQSQFEQHQRMLQRHPALVNFSNAGTRYTALMFAALFQKDEVCRVLRDAYDANVNVVVRDAQVGLRT